MPLLSPLKIQEVRTYLHLSTFVLAASAAAKPQASKPASISLFLLFQPAIRIGPAYQGEALRAFGSPLYSGIKRSTPIGLKALRRRPFGRRSRKAVKPYASYFLSHQAPFVEKPIAIATSPDLAKLRANWLSAWSPNDMQG